MRSKFIAVTSGCALAASMALAGASSAGQNQGQAAQPNRADRAGMVQQHAPGQQGTAQNQQRDIQGGYLHMYQAAGTITNLDQNAGRVTVKLTNGEEVRLNLPTAALQQFDQGDRVTVSTQLALAERPGQPGTAGADTHGMGNTGQAGGGSRSGTQNGTGTTGTR